MTYDEIKKLLPKASLDIIQRLGHDPVDNKPLVCDGKIGPRTKRAIYLPIDKLNHPAATLALEELLAGAMEINGNNRGIWVNKYFRLSSKASVTIDRGAWCAAFVTWVLGQIYKFPACWGAIRTVKDHMDIINIKDVQPGDAIAYKSLTRPYPAGHVGLVVLVEDNCIWCIEGNIDLVGKIDGVGVRKLTKEGIRSDGNKPYLVGRVRK